jgi:hypothetical protein
MDCSYRRPVAEPGLGQGRRRKDTELRTQELEWSWNLLALARPPRHPRSVLNREVQILWRFIMPRLFKIAHFQEAKEGEPCRRQSPQRVLNLCLLGGLDAFVQSRGPHLQTSRETVPPPPRRSPSASAPEETDSVSPIPILSFSCQFGQGPYQTADVRGRNCFFVHKDHATVRSLFFRPSLEQGKNACY